MTSQVRHHPPGPLHSRRERGEIPGKIKTCGFGGRASGKTGTKGKERKLGSRLRKTGLLVDEQTPPSSSAPSLSPSQLTHVSRHPRSPSQLLLAGVLSLYLSPPPTIARKLNFNFEPRGCRSETNIIIRNNSDTREGRVVRFWPTRVCGLRVWSRLKWEKGGEGRRRRRRWLRVV